MRMNSDQLRANLVAETKVIINYVNALKDLSLSDLNKRPNNDAWSTLECIEHLNRYAHFYNPELSKQIATSKHKDSGIFKSGILGNYFAESMLPKEKLNKMKTFKEMNPIHSKLNSSVIDEFLSFQTELLDLIEKSKSCDLSKTKNKISISKFIKLRIGDTFRIVINHNIRHIEQIKRTLAA